MNKVLELKNISKNYRLGSSNLEILKDLNLIICEGEIISIVGSSGSGKSTLLHIAGLLDSFSS